MSQHDLDLTNNSGAGLRADLNLALKALGSQQTGPLATLPATFSNQIFCDTTSGHILKRNHANDGWDYVSTIDQSIIASANGTSSYAINLSPAINAYQNGVKYHFIADVTCSGNPTLSINSLTAKYLKQYNESGVLTNLAPNAIPASQIVIAMWDAANDCFVVLNPSFMTNVSSVGVQGAYSNLRVYTSATQVTILADSLTLKNASNFYKTIYGVSLIINIDVTGNNGLETGIIESPNQWYSYNIFYNGTTVCGVLSTKADPSSITPPSGYENSYHARLGWVKNNASSNIVLIKRRGDLVHYLSNDDDNLFGYGNTSGTWQASSLGGVLPPYVKSALFLVKNEEAYPDSQSRFAIGGPETIVNMVPSQAMSVEVPIYEIGEGGGILSVHVASWRVSGWREI